MHVRNLKIERFRAIRELSFAPQKKTIILGPNNSGKSSILEALDLVLHSGFGRPRPQPSEIDYFNRNPSEGFKIEAVIGALSDDFIAETKNYLEGWNARDEQVVPEPDGENIEPVVRIRAIGNTEFEIVHEYCKEEAGGARVPPRIRDMLGWVFDGRIRDPYRELGFYQGGLLEKLFNGVDLGEALGPLSEALVAGAKGVNEHEGIQVGLANLATELRKLGLLVNEEIPIFEGGALSTRGLLQTLRLALPHGETQIPLSRQGRGAQRLVLLSVLILLTKQHGRTLIGGFEEPEEALEPLRQTQVSQLLNKIVQDSGQIFVVTHSPEIARAFNVDDFLLMRERAAGENICILRRDLSEPTRQSYERRIDGAVVRALFARVPLLVEGPGDRAILGVFWNYLANHEEGVTALEELGLDPINCEGANLIPGMARLLKEAGKSVAAWVELDRPDVLQRLRDDNCCEALWLHNARAGNQNLEQALAQSASVAALVSAISTLAQSRSYTWDDQRVHLISAITGIEAALRNTLAATHSIVDFFALLTEVQARELIAVVLGSTKASPFEMKGARQARIIAEGILAIDYAVPVPFANGIRALSAWVLGGLEYSIEISMAM